MARSGKRCEYNLQPRRDDMNWSQVHGWGLYVVLLGVVSFVSILYADSTALMIVLAVLGIGLMYHGVSMVRSGSHIP